MLLDRTPPRVTPLIEEGDSTTLRFENLVNGKDWPRRRDRGRGRQTTVLLELDLERNEGEWVGGGRINDTTPVSARSKKSDTLNKHDR